MQTEKAIKSILVAYFLLIFYSQMIVKRISQTISSSASATQTHANFGYLKKNVLWLKLIEDNFVVKL